MSAYIFSEGFTHWKIVNNGGDKFIIEHDSSGADHISTIQDAMKGVEPCDIPIIYPGQKLNMKEHINGSNVILFLQTLKKRHSYNFMVYFISLANQFKEKHSCIIICLNYLGLRKHWATSYQWNTKEQYINLTHVPNFDLIEKLHPPIEVSEW